jgi:ribosomal protein S27AE
MPVYLFRCRLRIAGLWLLFVCGAALGYWRLGWSLRSGFSIVLFAVMIAMLVAKFMVDRALRRKLMARDWLMCTRCGYDLRNLPDLGHCPECGTGFLIADVRKLWQQWFAYESN